MGRIKEEEGAKEGAMGMSGSGWRRERWEGVREGVGGGGRGGGDGGGRSGRGRGKG